MNKLKMIFSALFGATLAACARSENITTVDTAAFERAVTKDSVQLVDVRTAEEYADHHILYAVNIDVMQPDFKDKASAMLNASKPAYVYCRSGKRSLTAAGILVGMGFKVINLRGGIIEWDNK